MNNVNEIDTSPEFIEDQRSWLIEHKLSTGLSWSKLEQPVGRAGPTLSAFCSGTYGGSRYENGNPKVALEIYRYRQTLVAQAQLRIEAPDIPPYFETRTSRELMNLLTWAQRGRLAVCAGGPGIGKTMTLQEYADQASNVTIITCRPSLKTVTGLCMAVLAALGHDRNQGSSERLSRRVMTEIRNSQGLLIFDDAQHLPVERSEEIRGWYDQTGIGVALVGNSDVVARMNGGSRAAHFAQLYSRVGMKIIRPLPLEQDVEDLAAAWDVTDDAVLSLLKDIAGKPGGLRSCTFALEVATLIARSRGEELGRNHLAQAWSQLSSRPVAA